MDDGLQSLRVVGAFMNADVPLASSRRQDAYGLSRICPCQVREMAEGTAVLEVIGGVMGGKLHRLERRNSCNQQHYREQPQTQAAQFHRRLELYLGILSAERGGRAVARTAFRACWRCRLK